MLAGQGPKVMRLRRVAIGPIRLDRLPRGKARLKVEELARLRQATQHASRREQPQA
jgi:23S rRNA pseudouridine2605 synthase